MSAGFVLKNRSVSRTLMVIITLAMMCSLTFMIGCDAAVQSAVQGGFQALSYALIDAFFLSIEPQPEEEDTTITTYRLNVEQVTAFRC